MYCSRQYLLIDPKKSLHSHSNAHNGLNLSKLKCIVHINTYRLTNWNVLFTSIPIDWPKKKFATVNTYRLIQKKVCHATLTPKTLKSNWIYLIPIDWPKKKFATPTLTPTNHKTLWRPQFQAHKPPTNLKKW